MLTKIEMLNYRNLRLDSGVSLGALNIFIGPNGSGKSNLVKVLRFFQDALTGPLDAERVLSSFEYAVFKLGSGHILDASMEYAAVVAFFLYFSQHENSGHGFDLQLQVIDENTVTVRRESMYRVNFDSPGADPVYYFQAHGSTPGAGTATVKIGKSTKHIELENLPTNRLAYDRFRSELPNWLGDQGEDEDEPDDVSTAKNQDLEIPRPPRGASYIPRSVSQWSFYDSSRMNLWEIRKSRPQLGNSNTILSAAGENLLSVIHNLLSKDVAFDERMTEAMRQLFPQTRKLRVILVGRSTLELEWHINGGKRPFYLDEMSEGTVRMLCWMAVLLCPRPLSLIVLDEPEAGVHPAWLQILAGWIREAARSTQVIVSTHSSDLLDYFTEDIESVKVFHADAKDPQYYVVSPLKTEAVAEKLEEGWMLGDLYRVGDTGVGGWPW